MSFQTPLALLALLAIPLVALAYARAQRRRRRFAVRFPGAAALARLDPRPGRRHVPAVLAVAALAVGLVALARPEATVAVPVQRASVMLVTDGSGSMEATDVAPSRLQAARAAAEDFLDEVPDELQVGSVGFAAGPTSVLAPTDDRDAVRAALAGLRADGGTATGDALRAALDALPEPEGDGERPPAAIVLLSDGQTTSGEDPETVARAAAQRDVPIYTVSLGTAGGTVDGPYGATPVPPDPETMRAIAAATGGESFDVADAGELSSVYETLGSEIGTRPERREVTAGFAGVALLGLLGAAVGGLRRFGRL